MKRPQTVRVRPITEAVEARQLLSAVVDSAVQSLAIPTANLVDAGGSNFAELWTPMTINKAPAKPAAGVQSYLSAKKYRTFGLDAADVRTALGAAPMEFTAAADRPAVVTVPTPAGGAGRFAVVETQLMDPGLAAQFPDFKTYRGVGLDDPTATVRISLTSLGFNAQVLSANGGYDVDPYWHNSTTAYASYYMTDEAARGGFDAKELAADLAPAATATPAVAAGDTAARTSGTVLRTYRAAVAADGEYTAFFGGTVTAGQAAVVVAVNRVTGIYETELSIRLQLIANNSSIIYINATTDPYDNGSPSALLTKNQSTLDSVIGTANYDIGHVFTTGGGGLAGLGVVGRAGSKAQGETGLPSPVGDSYYVDFVAHEMGHQFGGNHTFNTSADTGNRNAGTAYEPGSGSTIMAYAGVEGFAKGDFQAHSDPYFAWRSQEEILTYVDNTVPTVGVRTNTGNAPPTVDGGADYTIPDQTPFTLTATGADANGDALTYGWEEADLGAATLLTTADNAASPLFRVRSPTTSPSRTFPVLSTVLAGGTAGTAVSSSFVESASSSSTAALVERLPTTTRNLNFNVTVRDSRAGGGGINSDTVLVKSVNSGNGFAITNLNAATTLTGGSTQTITWDVAGTTGNGINTAAVNVLLSTDGGQTFPTTLAAGVANSGSADVQLPFGVGTTTGRIKIQPVGNIYFDINNANLTITNVSATSQLTAAPAFAPGADTGTTGDGITRLNGGSTGTLAFAVGNTVAGATVQLLVGSTVVGTATATGTTTTVAVSTPLADGTYAVTARQTEPGKTASALSAAFSFSVDATAPTLPAGGFAFIYDELATDQRLSLTFSEPLSSFDLAGVTVVNTTTGQTISSSSFTLTAPTADNPTAGLRYNPTAAADRLPSGRYELRLATTAAADVAGNAVTATTQGFFFLDGDVNHDGSVTFTDLSVVLQNFNLTNATFSQGDCNYDGTVNFIDLSTILQNFNVALPATRPATFATTPATFATTPTVAASVGRAAKRDVSRVDVGAIAGLGDGVTTGA